MATADNTLQDDDDLPPFDDPRVRLVFDILCDDALPPNPEHRWESWYAKRIVGALFPKIGPATILPCAPPAKARAPKTGGAAP